MQANDQQGTAPMSQTLQTFLKGILDTIQQPCVVLDDRLTIQLANAAFCRLLNTHPSAVVHRRFERLFTEPVDTHTLRTALERTASASPNSERAQLANELLLPLPSGAETFQINLRYLHYEGKDMWLASFLRAAKHTPEPLLNELPIGVYRTLADGTFLHTNIALAAILGCGSVEELMTCSAADFYYDHEERQHQWQLSREAKGTTQNTTRFRTRDGRVIWVRDTSRPVFDERHKLLYVDGSIEDITEEVEVAARMRAITKAVDSTGDGVTIADANGIVIYQNAAHSEIFNYTLDELNDPTTTIKRHFSLQVKDAEIKQTLAVSGSWTGEVELPAKNGQRVYTLMRINRVTDEQGKHLGFVTTTHDITQINQAREAMRKMNEELELHNMTLAAINQISAEISAQVTLLNTDELLERVLQWAVALLDAQGGSLLLYHQESETLEVVAAVGSIRKFVGSQMQSSEGLSGMVLRTREPLMIADYTTWEHRREVLINTEVELKAVIGVPLLARDVVIGVINIVRNTPFDAQEAQLTQMFAAQAAVIIENARLFKEQRRQQEIATALRGIGMILSSTLALPDTLKSLIGAAEDLFPQANSATVQLLDRGNGAMETIAASNGLPRSADPLNFTAGVGIAGHAIAQKQVINTPDIAHDSRFIPAKTMPAYRSLMVAPLIKGDHVWGSLSIGSARINAFDAEDERLAEALGRQAAIAIENTMLIDEVRQFAAEQEQRVQERTGELQRAKRRVETILFNSTDGIALMSSDGIIEQTNPSFDALFDYDVDQAFGKAFIDLVVPQYHTIIQSAIQTVQQTRQSQRVEVELLRGNAERFAADMVLYTANSYNERHMSLVCSLRDVTERRQMEESLLDALEKEKQLSELKSRFGSMVSHEFRTPLAIILSSAELLGRYNDRITPEKRQHQIHKIQTQVRHMTDMLEDILLISRAETVGLDVRPMHLSLNSFFRDLLDEIGATTQNSHPIIFNTTAECEDAYLDGKLLAHALSNLIHNAIKYSPNGDSVTVDLSCNDDQVRIAVRDQGIGIPTDDLDRVFEPFHRGSNVDTLPGTGLGLAITKQSIEAQGGRITVESAVKQGTTFTIVMPRRLPRETLR